MPEKEQEKKIKEKTSLFLANGRQPIDLLNVCYSLSFPLTYSQKKKREMHWSFNFFFFTSIRSSFLYINKNIGRSIQVAKFNSEWCWMGRKKAVVCVLSPEFIQYYFLSCSFCFFGGASHQFFFVVVVRLAYKKKNIDSGVAPFFSYFCYFNSLLSFVFFTEFDSWWSSHTHTHTIDAWMVFFLWLLSNRIQSPLPTHL